MLGSTLCASVRVLKRPAITRPILEASSSICFSSSVRISSVSYAAVSHAASHAHRAFRFPSGSPMLIPTLFMVVAGVTGVLETVFHR
jgi:hypothetical protein